MNAKKIMGAVLVALLAAALFVGAGSAATYFAYQSNAAPADSVWQNGANTVTITGGVVGPVAVAGTYTLVGDDDTKAYFTNPTAAYSASGVVNGVNYGVVNGGSVYEGTTLKITVASLNTSAANSLNYVVTYPNGSVLNLSDNPWDSTGAGLVMGASDLGTYKIQALFMVSGNNFKADIPNSLLLDANSFSFTVVEKEAVTISASVDTAYSGEAVTFTVKGTPGAMYNVSLDGFDVALNQILPIKYVEGKIYNITIPNEGVAVFTAITNSSNISVTDKDYAIAKLGKGTTDVKKQNSEVKIKLSAPVVTATLGAPSYFIGQNIELSGTSTSEVKSTTFKFNLSGTNLQTEVKMDTPEGTADLKGKNWKVVLNVTEKVDVGTYTIKIYQDTTVVATVPVILKQPFISIIEAPEVIAQGTKAEFIINAEAAAGVEAYFFGTNFFINKTGTQENDDALNEFTVTLEESETKAAQMAAGQYFAVFQHPMYDTFFNIMTDDNGKFYLNTSAPADATYGTFLFDAKSRQTANAAQALCDALDSQNIDDMYVKYSFFVVGEDESFTISEIPTTIAQGETLTISGVSTANADGTVTVEMISTAFAAVPKETVGSAAFIAVTTKVAEDGTWEVTMDTSDLNVDEYSLKVAITPANGGETETWKNVKINVVEAADKPDTPDTPDVPDTPDTPDTPTEPETPGFGALAALAGLGAVAVLLLRRE